MDIFDSRPGFTGYFGPVSGGKTAITISRANSAGEAIDKGFLVNQYTISFSRGTSVRHFLNVDKPVAVVGFGQGTVVLNGLIGTAEAFQSLIGGTSSTKTDVCSPLTITVNGANGYVACEDGTSTSGSGCTFKAGNGIIAGFSITGQIQENGQTYQTADVTIQIGSLSVD